MCPLTPTTTEGGGGGNTHRDSKVVTEHPRLTCEVLVLGTASAACAGTAGGSILPLLVIHSLAA